MAQRYEYQDNDGHITLLFVHPANDNDGHITLLFVHLVEKGEQSGGAAS